MTLLQIILIIFIIPITILNIRFLTSGRKTKDITRRKYVHLLAILSDNEEKLGGASNYTAAKYVSDSGNNYLICKSKDKDIGALVTEENFFFFSSLSSVNCEIIIEKENDKKFKSITAIITSPEYIDSLNIVLAENAHRYKSSIGHFLLETAEDFKNELTKKN